MPSLLRLSLVLSLSTIAQGPDPTAQGPGGAPARTELAAPLLDAHNAERAREGKPPLRLSATLSRAALVHARDMASKEFMAHEGSDKSNPIDRVRKAGYLVLRTGENVARGQRTVPEVLRAWMDSPPHRKNILADYDEMGAAVVAGPDGRLYWAVEFGTPMPKLVQEDATRELLAALNEARAKEEPPLPPLRLAPALERSARSYAAAMARLDTLQPSKEEVPEADPDALVRALADDRYPIRKLSRAIVSGPPGPAEALASLLENDANRKDLLGSVRDVGIGYAFSDGSGRPYWCVLLASRR